MSYKDIDVILSFKITESDWLISDKTFDENQYHPLNHQVTAPTSNRIWQWSISFDNDRFSPEYVYFQKKLQKSV